MNSNKKHAMYKPPVNLGGAYVYQKGVALAISLILLVAMTILGVATLNGTRLAEKVTSNAQQKTITFEVAESAINSVFAMDNFVESMQGFDASAAEAPLVPQDDVAAMLANEFDQENSIGTSVDIEAEASIQYCGEGQAWGTDLNANQGDAAMVAHLFDVVGDASISNSNARSHHVKRGSYPMISMGFTNTCSTPGTK